MPKVGILLWKKLNFLDSRIFLVENKSRDNTLTFCFKYLLNEFTIVYEVSLNERKDIAMTSNMKCSFEFSCSQWCYLRFHLRSFNL